MDKEKIKKYFEFKIDFYHVTIFAICLTLNFLGKFAMTRIELPLFCDSLGTCLATFLCGPIEGMVSGIVTNVFFGITQDFVSIFYSITSICIAIVISILAKRNRESNPIFAFIIGIAVTTVSMLVSCPINLILYDGYTGNVYGDLVVELFKDSNVSLLLSGLFGQFVIEFPDKMLSVFVTYYIWMNIKDKDWLVQFRDNVFRTEEK